MAAVIILSVPLQCATSSCSLRQAKETLGGKECTKYLAKLRAFRKSAAKTPWTFGSFVRKR
jgi:hypothetical protein